MSDCIITRRGGRAKGDALPMEVLKGKTFSNKKKSGLTGILDVEKGSYLEELGDWTLGLMAENDSWFTVGYGNGLFVALAYDGEGSQVMTSPDGAIWTSRTIPARNGWSSICYGNGLFVAVRRASKDVMTSPDGIVWTLRVTPETKGIWQSVCYGDGLFVAVAESSTNNQVMTSPNGIDWTLRSLPTVEKLFTVCYGNGLFVALGSAAKKVMTSPDGINWTTTALPEAFTCWIKVCYGNGMFVAVGNNGPYRMMTSPDGINWTLRRGPEFPAYNDWSTVCYGNGLFVALGTRGTHRVMTSSDGINWTLSVGIENAWYSVCYGKGIFVAVGFGNNGSQVMSARLIREELPSSVASVKTLGEWTVHKSEVDNQWRSVCYGKGIFVAVTNTGIGNRVMTSPDGITWTICKSVADDGWRSVCYGNGLFVATGGYRRVMTSPDGVDWTVRNIQNDNWGFNGFAVCYGNGVFVAVGTINEMGYFVTSLDGITWTLGDMWHKGETSWSSICYGNGLFVAVAERGQTRIATSPDGIQWTDRTPSNAQSLSSVCYGKGLFVAVGWSPYRSVSTSLDGINWTLNEGVTYPSWCSVCYGNGLFVAVASIDGYGSSLNRLVMTSPDGINWTPKTFSTELGTNINWSSVCYGNGRFVVVSGRKADNCVLISHTNIELVTAISQTAILLGPITATYVNAKSINFNIKQHYEKFWELSTSNLMANFKQIAKTATSSDCSLSWNYNGPTGTLTCTSTTDMFSAGTTIADIYIIS